MTTSGRLGEEPAAGGTDELLAIARGVAAQAAPGEDIDVMISRGASTSVKVHDGEVESYTSSRSAAVGIRVIRDHRQGFAHAGSLDPDVVASTLADARDNAAYGEPDECYGLTPSDGLAPTLHDHWRDDVLALVAEDRVGRAVALERAVRGADPRIAGVRTTGWSDGWGVVAYAASDGTSVVERGTSCGLGTQPLAVEGDETQIGYAGDGARSPGDLDDERVAREAVDRATRLLGARQPRSARMSIVLEPRLAATLLGIVAGMLDGESVLKGRTPFAGRVGERIASPLLRLVDDPTATESLAASTWDAEGLACRRTSLVDGGVLSGFLDNGYTGRRRGVPSTASAVRSTRSLPGVGAQVLVVGDGSGTAEEVLAAAGDALFVASFAGLHSGVNPVSGDFSVGADGLMVRGGELAEPVREITIASSLQRLLLDIVAVGGDGEWLPSGDYVPTLVIADVAIGGA